MKYLLKTTEVYRVETEEEVLKLRDELSQIPKSELISFAYNTKTIKAKGEVIEEYQVVKATLKFNEEKEPEEKVEVIYE